MVVAAAAGRTMRLADLVVMAAVALVVMGLLQIYPQTLEFLEHPILVAVAAVAPITHLSEVRARLALAALASSSSVMQFN